MRSAAEVESTSSRPQRKAGESGLRLRGLPAALLARATTPARTLGLALGPLGGLAKRLRNLVAELALEPALEIFDVGEVAAFLWVRPGDRFEGRVGAKHAGVERKLFRAARAEAREMGQLVTAQESLAELDAFY